MLLRDATVTVACKTGTNLAEVEPVGEEEFVNGEGRTQRRPIFAGKYVNGLPFGVGSGAVSAPVDLSVGDLVRVEVSDWIIYEVVRKGKPVYAHEGLHAEQTERAERVAAREALKRELRQ